VLALVVPVLKSAVEAAEFVAVTLLPWNDRPASAEAEIEPEPTATFAPAVA
jgi:hypothetical protein